ncbi:MAG: hypothetical protein ACP5JG_14290 [Anaerolineae bacterium]
MIEPLPTGFYPFWFWNATLDADEIRWQVAEMAHKGIRGFYIHPRQGLGQPYLSEAFFEMVAAAVEAAEMHDMVVHLYDEYPYPSGVAGGEVILGSPQYHGTRLVQRTYDLSGGPVRQALPRGKVLACVATPLVDGRPNWDKALDLRRYVGPVLTRDSYNEMGLTQYNRKRYFASDPTPTLETTLPERAYRLFFSVQAEIAHHKYWNHFVDPMNAEAIEHFIELTHERYFARFGDKFGSTIRSVFVDETAPGWSQTLPAAFKATTGRDLLRLLPILQDPVHPEHLEVAYALQEVRYTQFCKTFEAQISAWCRDHNIAYAGEKPSMRMAQLRYMDIPGCEPGHTKVGVRPDWLRAQLRGNAKATASAAYFYDKPDALCECYHSLGWSATLQDAKTIADGLLLAGIRYLVPHGFFYTTHGLVKHDAPPTFFFQMPFWPLFGHLSKYVGKVGEHFEGTHIDAEILVVDPTSGLPSWHRLDVYTDAYEELLWTLMRHHLDFHIVDNDILAEGELVPGGVEIADIQAKVVVVPPMQVIEPELLAWLEDFVASGGTAVKIDLSTELDDVLTAIGSRVSPSLSIHIDGREVGDIVVVKRVGYERTVWFALNLSRDPLDVILQSGDGLRELPLEEQQSPRLRIEEGHYMRHVAPFESFMLTDDVTAPIDPVPPIVRIQLSGPAEIQLRDDNLLRLGTWKMSLRGEDGAYGPAAPVEPKPLANQLSETGLVFAPLFRHHFGHGPELSLPELTVRYETSFARDYDGSVELVMEPGSVRGDWSIRVNDGPSLTAEDFAATEAHVRGSLGAEITSALRRGTNTIHVEITTDRLDGGLLNPLYLAGRFGVTLAPVGMAAPKADGRFEHYVENLLPYYAGVVDYTMRFELSAVPEGRTTLVALETSEPFHEAAEVAINDGEFMPVMWEPRQVEVPTQVLRSGENVMQVRVYTTLIRSFEGQWFDYEAHRYREIGGPTADKIS